MDVKYFHYFLNDLSHFLSLYIFLSKNYFGKKIYNVLFLSVDPYGHFLSSLSPVEAFLVTAYTCPMCLAQ